MLRQALSRTFKETGWKISPHNSALPATANFRTRPHSTEAFEDLIETGKTKKNYSVRSQKRESVIQRVKEVRLDPVLAPVEAEVASQLLPKWSQDEIEEAIRSHSRPKSTTGQKRRPSTQGPGPKKKFTSEQKTPKRPKSESGNDPSLTDLQALSKLSIPGAKGTAAAAGKGHKGSKKSKSASLYGQEEEPDQLGELDENDTSLLEDEHWGDVDPGDMRLFRQLTTWRNPVTAEPGEPALFKQIKTGYEIFAEERTRFELQDTSLASSHRIDPAASDYSQYLPGSVSEAAPRDAGSIEPVQLAKLNLAFSHDLTLRQRENVVTAIEDFLSRAQPRRSPPAA